MVCVVDCCVVVDLLLDRCLGLLGAIDCRFGFSLLVDCLGCCLLIVRNFACAVWLLYLLAWV